MKQLMKKTAIVLFVGLLMVSFTIIQTEKKIVNVSKSTIEWTGKKVTGKHHGTINLKSGYFLYKDKKLVGGEFVIDMNTILNTDLKGDNKAKLEKHLNSDDFFGVATYSESSFKISKVVAISANKYTITGDLSIKGKTFEQTFEMSFEKDSAQGTVVIDRTKYDIKYRSGSFFDNLGDKAISNNFELNVNLVF